MNDQKSPQTAAGVALNRRNLLIGGGTAVGLGVAGLGGLFLFDTPARVAEKIVRGHLPGLEITDSEMAQFVADFVAADHHTSRTEELALRLLAPFVNAPPFRWMVPGFVHRGFENYERRVMNEFIMGTDFFETYAKGHLKVSYFGLYSVNEAPCASPLPRFPQEPDAA